MILNRHYAPCMWRTEVNISARTWTISTTRVGLDSATGEDVYETVIIVPGQEARKSLRHCSTPKKARQSEVEQPTFRLSVP